MGETLASRLKGGTPEAFVFADADGKFPCPNWLRRGVLYPALRKAGLPVIPRASGFHAFRHSAASLIAAGGNLKLAQAFLGHSHLSTTADIYMHTSTTAERAAAQTLEDAIFCRSVP
jgi:integrase